MTPRRIDSPDQPTPYADAAPAIQEGDLGSPLPIPFGQKSWPPAGYTGADRAIPDDEKVQGWVDTKGGENVALAVRRNVVGVDVDAHDGKLGMDTLIELEKLHGRLPPTWSVTSRTNGSHLAFYRLPEGVTSDGWANQYGPGIDVIRYGHRYAMVAPSVHPNGGTYRWVMPDGTDAPANVIPELDDLAEMPMAWVGLVAPDIGDITPPAERSDVNGGDTWTGDMAGRATPQVTPETILGRYREAIAGGEGSRHDHMVEDVLAMTRMGEQGWSQAATYIDLMGTEFVEMADATKREGGARLARSEFTRSVDGAATKVTATPTRNNGSEASTTNANGQAKLPRSWVESVESGAVILDTPPTPDPLWGTADECAWARGEPLLVYAATGIGKTTVADQLLLRMVGIGEPTLLGLPVVLTEGTVLLLAYDRPAQALRSLARMVEPYDRDVLAERLLVERRRLWRVKPDDPEALWRGAAQLGVTVIVIDSLKDVAANLSDPEMATAYNDAIQTCVARGIDVLTLHHPRKTGDGKTRILSLDDVYGSTWVTAGQGSVVALNGDAGTTVAEWAHLKMPSGEVGPFTVRFDYLQGTVKREGILDVLDPLVGAPGYSWVPITDITLAVYGDNDDTNRKKAKRRLQKYEVRGLAESTGQGRGKPVLWRVTEKGRKSASPPTIVNDTPNDRGGTTSPTTPNDTGTAPTQKSVQGNGSGQRHTQRRSTTPTNDVLPLPIEGQTSLTSSEGKPKPTRATCEECGAADVAPTASGRICQTCGARAATTTKETT